MIIEFSESVRIEQHFRKRFQTGELAKGLHSKYPNIFDDDDLRLALSQPNYHFYEWVAARYLYEERGYYSLVEQYQYKSHKRKQSILQKLDFDSLLKAIEYQEQGKKVQSPDLLVYKPDFSDWFFCEVKSETDRLREVQKKHFEILSTIVNKPIYILKIKLIKE